MKKIYLILSTIVLVFTFAPIPSSATTIIGLDPTNQIFNIGDSLVIDLVADIDLEDAIMGFGFDLSFDNGATFVSGPGASGSALTFDSFTPNNTLNFNYDPLFDSDGDTISGTLGFMDRDVSGTGIILGSFAFTAFSLNPERILISADDVDDITSEEGLIPGFSALRLNSFLPNEPTATATATASPVPEPTTILLLTSGMIGLGVFGRRKMKN